MVCPYRLPFPGSIFPALDLRPREAFRRDGGTAKWAVQRALGALHRSGAVLAVGSGISLSEEDVSAISDAAVAAEAP